MTAALETLLLTFSGETPLAIPQQALFLGAEPHPALAAWPEVLGWQPLRPLADAWEKAGYARTHDLRHRKFPCVLILPGKSRDETLALFAEARGRLAPGGTLVCAMPNTAGAGRFEKELARATGTVTSLQKNKCRAFHATDDGTWAEEIFAEWRTLGQARQISSFTVLPGIFSSDHIDPGSQLLADHLPAHLRGKVADLGAGWGFLSDAALRRAPGIQQIDLYEADARALHCAEKNLAAHDRPITYHWHDVTTGLPDTYDTILMNPPFHTGQATDVDLGRAFLLVAAASLRRGGQLLLVANRQLPYEAALTTHGLTWRKVAEDKIYKILFATKR